MRRAEQIRYLVLAVQREGNRRLAAALRPLELTPSQAEAVRVVGDFGPLSLQDVGRLLICENGTNPSRLVDRLVEAGLVSREVAPDDRRRVTLSLTPAGRAAESAVRAIEEELYRQIDAALESAAGGAGGHGASGDAPAGAAAVDTGISLLAALAAGSSAADALQRRRVTR